MLHAGLPRKHKFAFILIVRVRHDSSHRLKTRRTVRYCYVVVLKWIRRTNENNTHIIGADLRSGQ
jgi:hypothetical protein